jgi:hypothetical protein
MILRQILSVLRLPAFRRSPKSRWGLAHVATPAAGARTRPRKTILLRVPRSLQRQEAPSPPGPSSMEQRRQQQGVYCTSPSPPRDRRGFEIALICALRVEADCVQAAFDKFWEDEGKIYGQARGDQNSYTTGIIRKSTISFWRIGQTWGKVGAAGVAVSLRSSFPEIRLALVVGICGGVSFGTDEEEILLGDIIISQALVQYDFGRQYPEAFEEKDTLEDRLGRPS